jgi:hypothetical protein
MLDPTFRTIAKGVRAASALAEATPTRKYYPNLAVSALETTGIAAFLASSLTPHPQTLEFSGEFYEVRNVGWIF